MNLWRRLRRCQVKAFAAVEAPVAWAMLYIGLGTFVAVLVGLVTVGEFRVATLIVALGLFAQGFGMVQKSEDDTSIDADE